MKIAVIKVEHVSFTVPVAALPLLEASVVLTERYKDTGDGRGSRLVYEKSRDQNIEIKLVEEEDNFFPAQKGP